MDGRKPFGWNVVGAGFTLLWETDTASKFTAHELLQKTRETCMRGTGINKETETAGSVDQRKEAE